MGTKLCPRCRKDYNTKLFYNNRGHSDGLSSWCKTCTNIARDERRERKKALEKVLNKIFETHKTCPMCNKLLRREEFPSNKSKKEGLAGYCRSCSGIYTHIWRTKNKERIREQKREYIRRNRKRIKEKDREYYEHIKKNHPEKIRENGMKHRYGIGLIEYDKMAKYQNNRCIICGKVAKRGRGLCVDHIHGNGHIRGLLCRNCNSGLGYFQDNENILQRAAEYTKKQGELQPLNKEIIVEGDGNS